MKVCVALDALGSGSHALWKNASESERWRVYNWGDSQSGFELGDSLVPPGQIDMVIEPMRFLTTGQRKNLLVKQYLEPYGYHSEQAIRLEDDRHFGKQIARLIGLNVPPWWLIKFRSEIDNIDDLGDKIVLKYNHGQMIGIYSRTNAKQMLPDLLEHGPVIVEPFLEGDCEINECFLINGQRGQHMATLIEENRLSFGGGKAGTVWSAHKASFVRNEFQQALTNQMCNVAKQLTDHGFCGWVDVSFMVVHGVPCFTEWMVRNSCSNFITMLHQMKIEYPELITRMVQGQQTLPEDIWRAHYSVGVQIFNIPMPSSADLGYFPVYGLKDLINSRDKDKPTFDLLEGSAKSWNGNSFTVPHGVTSVGVVSLNLNRTPGVFDRGKEGIKMYNPHFSKERNMLMDTIREVTGKLNAPAYRFLGE